ncbi:Pimeloyl-ACP methyl ester carboxylesterase [Rhizobium sp. NFR07]|uniref:alpha/beta fold hydrolase n=1 Tax=Rhizobium sp. NFR07 TaxID=1566262 RepID=UPI0008F256A8|nr:alpha/beta hydrolase [Rhizobium sp. NFR07]SFB64221.1 Pimeloyl-ACP methyl ester carboxylesterase [Rhizobium sp. NFR07]
MIFPIAVLAVLAAAFGFTAWQAGAIERRFPRHGDLTDVGGYKLNSLHIKGPEHPSLPPIVFIHGASGNLRDQETAFRKSLEGRAELLFVDRPGHGYSERGGPENDVPEGQAAAIARLMELKGIDRTIIVGHSLGGAIAASFAVFHPEKTAGLLFLAPATHPWPGGVDWYYNVAATPYLGWWFTHLLSLPAGMMMMDGATKAVFSPNQRRDRYVDEGAPALVLRPENFRNNAIDVANLNAYVARIAPRYREIRTPTVIVTGDSDPIVLEEIHSQGLARDIAGSELVMIHGLGHKPDYVVTDVAVAALEKLSGIDRDLQSMARAAEARLTQSGVPSRPAVGLSVEKG